MCNAELFQLIGFTKILMSKRIFQFGEIHLRLNLKLPSVFEVFFSTSYSVNPKCRFIDSFIPEKAKNMD